MLHLTDLGRILDSRRYPRHKHHYLLEIMGKFELCIPLDKGDHYLVPSLLSPERPAFNWPINETLRFQVQYDLLPVSILHRLMVRLHNHIWQQIYWRDGVIFVREGNRALITANRTDKYINIVIDGHPNTRRHLLSILRAELAEIHTSFAQLGVVESVPVPGYLDKAIRYDALRRLEAKGINSYYDATNDIILDVQMLLEGIETSEGQDAYKLNDKLVFYFNLADLRSLAFKLGIDYETLPHNEKKTEFARELVLYCQRHKLMPELSQSLKELRPRLD